MTRSLDAVGFDLDGTLVDTMVVAPSVYASVIRALGGPDLTVDDITGIWHIGPTPTVLGHFLGRPITPADLKVFHERFDEATRSIEPFDGIATRDHEPRVRDSGSPVRRRGGTLGARTGDRAPGGVDRTRVGGATDDRRRGQTVQAPPLVAARHSPEGARTAV